MTDTPTPHLDGPPPFTDDDLDTWVADPDQHENEGHSITRWRPTDPDSAEWAMAKLADLEREAIAVQTSHDEWAAKVERSRNDALRGLDAKISFFTQALRGYALDWHDEYPTERRTLHLPSGVVKCTTPQKPTVQLVPARAAETVAWLRSLKPEAVAAAKALKETDPEPMVSGVRKLVQAKQVGAGEWVAVDPEAGEILPFLRVDPPGPTTAQPSPHLS